MKDLENIEKLYDSYAQRLYSTSLGITADSFDAEEAMQETFIKYLTFPGRCNIENREAWLVSVCIRKSIDIIRARRREKEMIGELFDEERKIFAGQNYTGELEIDYTSLNIENIRKAIGSLPDGYRVIITLHLIEGYDYEEIAQITGLKESSVRSQYLRAKRRLAELLKN